MRIFRGQISSLAGARIAVKIRLTLKPGQDGTKSLVKKYGDALVCVRFRYDELTRQRVKTVELIVERSDWEPTSKHFSHETVVPLRIAASNMAIRSKAKAAGARWNPEKRLWYICYGQIVGTELEKYIDVDGFGEQS